MKSLIEPIMIVSLALIVGGILLAVIIPMYGMYDALQKGFIMNLEMFNSILIFIIGTIFGSFYNVVGYRLPNKMSIVFPSSHCPNCNHKLKFYELIPILSYLFLKGKCKNCSCSWCGRRNFCAGNQHYERKRIYSRAF